MSESSENEVGARCLFCVLVALGDSLGKELKCVDMWQVWVQEVNQVDNSRLVR